MTVTIADIEAADISDLSVHQRVEAFYKGTNAIRDFAQTMVIPVLNNQLNLNDKELAGVGTYYRAYAFINTMVTLNSRVHFQTVASTCRSLFEIEMDLKLLVNDTDGTMVDRFHAFPEIERYRSAKKLVNFADQSGSSTLNIEPQRNLLNSPDIEQRINSKIEEHWGTDRNGRPNWPKHWSGIANTRAIAHSLGTEFEERYVDAYSYLSWYIHAGSTGYAGLEAETLEAGFGRCHSIAQRSFLNTTMAISELIPLHAGIQNLNSIVERLGTYTGEVIVEEQIQMLEEMQRNRTQS